ncbi:MAG TPA: hypothetical protein VKY73_17835 [Polyangiaceae bacterium]|nr:hypothetical protein [Polyangiaceae bacterium]
MTVERPPEAIEELVVNCLDYVRRASGVELDFTPETLSVLDHYAATARAASSKNPALGPLVAPALGAYFGEVIRTHFGAFWVVPGRNVHDWAVCWRVAYLALNPIGVGFDALYGGAEHDGPSSALRVAAEDREYLDRRLAALPEVPEDEFHLFTTRFEVLEVATEALLAKMEEEGYGGTEFTEADYGVG